MFELSAGRGNTSGSFLYLPTSEQLSSLRDMQLCSNEGHGWRTCVSLGGGDRPQTGVPDAAEPWCQERLRALLVEGRALPKGVRTCWFMQSWQRSWAGLRDFAAIRINRAEPGSRRMANLPCVYKSPVLFHLTTWNLWIAAALCSKIACFTV